MRAIRNLGGAVLLWLAVSCAVAREVESPFWQKGKACVGEKATVRKVSDTSIERYALVSSLQFG